MLSCYSSLQKYEFCNVVIKRSVETIRKFTGKKNRLKRSLTSSSTRRETRVTLFHKILNDDRVQLRTLMHAYLLVRVFPLALNTCTNHRIVLFNSASMLHDIRRDACFVQRCWQLASRVFIRRTTNARTKFTNWKILENTREHLSFWHWNYLLDENCIGKNKV